MKTTNDNIQKKKNSLNSFYDDYLEIMKTNGNDFISKTEWQSPGDQFEKLSMYDDYTPVETSSNTQIN